MTHEELTLLAIKGAIEELPDDQREACKELAEFFRQNIKRAGSAVGPLALAVVGAELAITGGTVA